MSDNLGRKSLRNLSGPISKDSLLEAKDAYGNWYPVKVLSVEDSKVHVHFCNWSSRYDAWYPINSDCLRVLKQALGTPPMKRTSSNRHVDYPSKMGINGSGFTIGSYVMAAWRNDFEYLAEVLAHRQRHGNKSEYRVRYVWDRVIEWVPISRLRKATQYEIDYVLRFCKEHSIHGTTRQQVKSDSCCPSDSSGYSQDAVQCSKKIRSTFNGTRSDEKRTVSEHNTTTGLRSTRITPSSSSSIEEKKINNLSSFDGPVEQDGMLYDKSVLQFHEACRRRRELKRRAIEAEEKASNHVPSCDHSDISSDTLIIPNTSIIVNSNIQNKISTDEHTLAKNVSDVSFQQPSQNSSNLVVELSPVKTVVKSSDLVELHLKSNVGVDKDVTQSLKQPTLVNNKTKEENASTNTIRHSLNLLKTESKSVAPVKFPCPHCPRQLRNSKLLNAHLRNYHKDASSSTKPKSNHVPRKVTRSAPTTAFSEQKCSNLSGSNTILSSTNPKFTRLLSCHRCGSYAYVSEEENDLLECNHCFCWFHQSCYNLAPTDVINNSAVSANHPNICDGCRIPSRYIRPSRKNEWKASALRTNGFQNISKPMGNNRFKLKRHLVSETWNILDQTTQLRSLLTTGWHTLNKVILPTVPTIPGKVKTEPQTTNNKYEPTLKVSAESDSLIKNRKHNENTDTVVPDVHVSEDQVKRLYMELRGIAFGHFPETTAEITPVKYNNSNTNSHSLADMNPFSISTPDSECPNSSWPLDDATEHMDVNAITSEAIICQPTDPAYALSTQDLSGFLQDLGPDVIPEISGLSDDCVLNDNVSTAVEEFLKTPKFSGTPQQPLKLNQEVFNCTPTKDFRLLFGSNHTEVPEKSSANCDVSSFNRISPLRSSEESFPVLAQAPSISQSSDVNFIACSSDFNLDADVTSDQIKLLRESQVNQSEEQHSGPNTIDLAVSYSRPLVSELTKGALTDEFALPLPTTRCNSTKVPFKLVSVSGISTEATTLPSTCGLNAADIDWLETDTNNRLGHSTFSSDTFVDRKHSSNVVGSFHDLQNNDPFDLEKSLFTLSSDQIEKLSQTQNALEHIDELIITPFENALSAMEARLDEITAQVDSFDNDDWSSSDTELPSADIYNSKSPTSSFPESLISSYSPSSKQHNDNFGSHLDGKSTKEYSTSLSQQISSDEHHKIPIDDLDNYLQNAKSAAHKLFRRNLTKRSKQVSSLCESINNTLLPSEHSNYVTHP